MDRDDLLEFLPYVIFLIIVIYLMFLVSSWTNNNYITNKELNFAKKVVQNYITTVEKERYISSKTKSSMINILNSKFDKVEIDGTLEPVNEGENVYIILTVSKKIDNKTLVVQGVAQ